MPPDPAESGIHGEILSLIRSGDLLSAYDTAMRAIGAHADDRRLKYLAVLCLVRAGALERAMQGYRDFGLDAVEDDEDIIAMGGRLLKTAAFEADGAERRKLTFRAAEKYETAFRITGGSFSGINTATLFRLGGERTKSAAIARKIIERLPDTQSQSGEEAYYLEATRAEALLLLERYEDARQALNTAVASDPKNYSARATTLAQFSRILEAQDGDPSFLDRYRPPRAAHFAGHMFHAGCEDESGERRVRAAVDRIIRDENIGFGYGALAAGSDIVIAEAMLAAGCDLHLIQPCLDDAFTSMSLIPFGAEWVERYRICRGQAKSVRFATHNTPLTDDLDLAYSSRIAMGQTILRARSLMTEAVQLAVWDERLTDGRAGTGHDVACWAGTGHRQIIVPYHRPEPETSASPADNPGTGGPSGGRVLMAMLFLDTHGFGRLDDNSTALFVEHVLGRLAEKCRRAAPPPDILNTWGDGLFLAFSDIMAASETALDLQDCFQQIDLEAAGLPDHLALRVGCHVGPVKRADDPFHGRPNVFGSQVTLASRVESMTLPGSVYATEAYASLLATEHGHGIRCDYVGRVPRKDNGESMPLFSLRREGRLQGPSGASPVLSARARSGNPPAGSRAPSAQGR